MWFCFYGNILNFGLCQVNRKQGNIQQRASVPPKPQRIGKKHFFPVQFSCTFDLSVAFHFIAASCSNETALVLVDSLFHAVSWMVFILAQTSLTSCFSKTHLYWWSQRKNASETEPRILQTGHSKPFAVGEHFQNICPCFDWLKGQGFLKCSVLKTWELNILLPRYRQLKEMWGSTIISIAKYS